MCSRCAEARRYSLTLRVLSSQQHQIAVCLHGLQSHTLCNDRDSLAATGVLCGEITVQHCETCDVPLHSAPVFFFETIPQFNLMRVLSLCESHANLLCVGPISADVAGATVCWQWC